MINGRLMPLFFALSAALAPTSVFAQEFTYSGDSGPAFWDLLNPAWTSCGQGGQQSPVDLPGATPARQWQLRTDYKMSTGAIFNNGHTIEVEVDGENYLRLGGIDYQLTQFHFHTGSEHRVNGRGYDMELHLVHKSTSGALAVIGVFLRRGSSSGALAPIFANLPALDTPINQQEELPEGFNPINFLPGSSAFYNYAGSLTTPPCTEGVNWIVMSEPLTVSDEDIAQFAKRIPFNARYVQRDLD